MMQATVRHKLVTTLPSDKEVRMERMFDAPRQLVWNAFTKAEMIEKWWGRTHTTTRVDKLDLRVGGAWRFVESEPDGSQHCFRGEFRTVSPIDELAFTFEYEPLPGHVVLDTIRLKDHGTQTRMIAIATFDSKDDRDGMVAAGMEGGAAESYDKLDELLASLQ